MHNFLVGKERDDWVAKRTQECPSMHPNGTCARINRLLGWEDGVHDKACDMCFMNGPDSEGSGELRKIVSQRVVDHAASLAPYQTPHVKAALITIHGKQIDEPTPEMVEASPRLRWFNVRETWRKAQSLAKSVASGKCEPHIYAERQASCEGCEYREESKKAGEYFCGVCGCGDTALARLDHKLWYKYLECPMRRKGFSNATE